MSPALAQENLYKFPIHEEGIYRIHSDQLSQLGFPDVNQVAIFGYPGPLPQLLDESSLELIEIPTHIQDGHLWVFLSPANKFIPDSAACPSFQNHPYTDVQRYLIGRKELPKRVAPKTLKPETGAPATLYQWSAANPELENILNSGRTWYSKPIAAGTIRSIPFRQRTESNAPWKLKGNLMGQSITEGKVQLIESGTEIFSTTIASIPSSRYGVKGIEQNFSITYLPEDKAIETIELAFESSDPNGQGYFEYLALGVPIASDQLEPGIYFPNSDAGFPVSNIQWMYWDVSDFWKPSSLSPSDGGEITSKKIAITDPNSPLEIKDLEVANLGIRSSPSTPELIIICPDEFLPEAETLRTHKLTMGIEAEVVTTTEIYDGFGYGNPDPVAIRNFLAWHFQNGQNLKNVLLLGKGTFDYKSKVGGRPNLIPSYSSRSSLDPLTTYSSDDFYGLLSPGQGIWTESREGDELLQIGVGRIPVINRQEASLVVNKIIAYENSPSLGNWKRDLTWIADDGDNNIHLRDAEKLSAFLAESHSTFKQHKQYLDRFNQENQQSPQAKEALLKTLKEGTLFLNYIGHGNESTLAVEEIFRIEDISNWPEMSSLPLWITATCEFGRHDSPYLRSAAEELLIAKGKGAIGLLATGRPVFSSVNFSLNEAFIKAVLAKEPDTYEDLGSIFRQTKNNSLNGSLNRNFSLLGDPSLKLAQPEYQARITSFTDATGTPLTNFTPLEEIHYFGEINNLHQAIASEFQGEVEVELMGPATAVKTLGDESAAAEFKEEQIILFKGIAKVTNGQFEGSLILPQGLDVDLNTANFRLFATSPTLQIEAMGVEHVTIGGESNSQVQDFAGPEIRVLVEGQEENPWVFPSASLQIRLDLKDSSGIDVSGLTPNKNLQIRVNESKTSILNSQYRSLNASYREGYVLLEASDLNEGINYFQVQAYDLVGNGSILEFEVEVRGSTSLKILKHKVYPNPASTQSQFEILHNKPDEMLILSFEIINSSGQILFSDSYRLIEADKIIKDLSWIFLQDQTKYPAKGTYIYKITLQSEQDGTLDSVSGKILIE
ncbi:type IX secretion system sortase PorU [Algoriphagus vanfongensis]|uniref:type IX secretion system sortase PorU n=1 Tax=Algoriphagus vanfongensis TaxID=426371 RepID=UPI00042828C2|nr:type IX secretion system sortase PorU [Algoriphagus vanfongensis]